MAFFPGSLCCLAPGSGIPPAAARSFPGARKQITRRSGPVQKAPGEQPGRRSRPPAVCSAGASLARRSYYWCRSFSCGHENGLAPFWAGLPRYAQRLPAWEGKERMGRPRARPRQRLCAPAASSGRADSDRPSGGGRFRRHPLARPGRSDRHSGPPMRPGPHYFPRGYEIVTGDLRCLLGCRW